MKKELENDFEAGTLAEESQTDLQPEELKKEGKPESAEAEPSKETSEPVKSSSQNYWEQMVRLKAEFENYRKRTEKEKIDAVRLGREIMIERMISLSDVMEEAVKHSKNATDIGALKKGFEMVLQEFTRFLKSEGVEPLKTAGAQFDPHLHEALERVSTEEEEKNNVILEEIQKGYLFNGRLLRPAKVKVAQMNKKKQAEHHKETENGSGEG